MKRLNVAVLGICWLAMMLAIAFFSHAESGDRRINTTTQKERTHGAVRIVDQNGRPALNGVPSATSQIFDVAVGQGGDVFVPDTLNISVGDTVRWT